MNQTLFESWVIDQLNQNEDTQKTKIKREKKRQKSKEDQQNIKEMTDLEALFNQMTLTDKKLKQQSIVKIDFEKNYYISSVQDEEFLKWIFSQLRIYFSFKKISQMPNKIDSLFQILFDQKEIEFLEQSIGSRLGMEKDQRILLKNIFNSIFEV
ncbi:unnamed protein product (macronuclear) [Paramecium tetraurelia]|uniref:Uncharacterized protein n=1 Tax=Paramecium tetraurelia TaxID=5888 RepID=A0DRU6_PARTE|nr:uncharacterized protein GSPATT00019481001 [Paramecium tetraurelia]CAK85763.1 unnamed protein product [Paramecium tetraurelia]|eukprot:XP_001453160.1 hypothetical protein (macronuclear) [Paramecium tetraurelia strain d4-2]